MAKPVQSTSFVSEKIAFFKEAWVELKKVQTPKREETWRATLSVIFMVAMFGLFLGLTDYIVGSFIRGLLGMSS
jgi:preprotein translocase SecE subunit